ncbi:hypothetical protein U1Q18_011453 [Sarracenia purpurea var. burkii]
MEWSDIYETATSDPSFLSSLTPQFEADHEQPAMEWTFEENKLFENALAEFGLESPVFFDHVASMLPCKSMEQIKRHYDCLIEDVQMIEAGLFPTPNYVTPEEENEGDSETKPNEKPSSKQARKTCNGGHQRKRGVPWTEEEHQLFLMGLNKYGKGDWRSISRYYVVTKTPTQVASHAQKFFRRQTSTTPSDRRRPSIHDIQTVNSAFFSFPQKHKNSMAVGELQVQPPSLPIPPSPYSFVPMYNDHHFNDELAGFANQIPVFPPETATFPTSNSVINQLSSSYPGTYLSGYPGAHPSSSYSVPYPRNYP